MQYIPSGMSNMLTVRFFGTERVWVCDLSIPCRAASEATDGSQILPLVCDVFPIKICSKILCLYRGYWHTKQFLAFNPPIWNPYFHPFRTEAPNSWIRVSILVKSMHSALLQIIINKICFFFSEGWIRKLIKIIVVNEQLHGLSIMTLLCFNFIRIIW